MTESNKDEQISDTLAQALLDSTPRELYLRAEPAEAASEHAGQQCNDALNEAERLKRERDKQKRRADALERATIDVGASLVAAISLLESGGKEAAPSDTMFRQMLTDYKASLDRARSAVTDHPATGERDAYDGPPIPETTWEIVDELNGASTTGDRDCCAKVRADDRERCEQIIRQEGNPTI